MWQVIWKIPVHTSWTPDGIPIYGFGLMLFFAFVFCTWLARARARKEGIDPEAVDSLAIWIFLGGLAGARLTSLLSTGQYPPLLDPSAFGGWLWKFVSIWDGGIVLYGAVLGGVASFFLAYWLYYRKDGFEVLRFLDVVAPSVALGLVLGRLGCFLNGCCYGQVAAAACLAVTPVGFPMCAPPREATVQSGCQTVAGFTHGPGMDGRGAVVGMVSPGSPAYDAGLREGAVIVSVNGSPITSSAQLDVALGNIQAWPRGRSLLEMEVEPKPGAPAVRVAYTPYTIGLYPTQLYESVSMLLLMLVLLAYTPLRRNPGQVTAVLMIAYGLHRYLNELLRDDPRPKGLESYGSVALVTGGLLLWLWLNSSPPKAPVLPWQPKAEGRGKPQGDATAVNQNITR
jgi:prolipoprotein diacylglyceryltransferase